MIDETRLEELVKQVENTVLAQLLDVFSVLRHEQRVKTLTMLLVAHQAINTKEGH